MNVLVLGASRGIGLEFVRQYRAAGDTVMATARDDAGLARLQALGVRALTLDVTGARDFEALARALQDERIDLALYVAGVMSHGDARLAPSPVGFDRVMRTNVWGAMQALARFAPQVDAAAGRFVCITSGMGHIGSVGSSHSWVYRASKAALNMAVAAAQCDWPQATLVAMSPGWVRTAMGGDTAPMTVEDSVRTMRAAIATLGREHRGAFLDHDGRRFDGW